jgi:hypothetical protein
MTKIHFSPEVVDIDIDDVGHGVQIKLPKPALVLGRHRRQSEQRTALFAALGKEKSTSGASHSATSMRIEFHKQRKFLEGMSRVWRKDDCGQ